VKTESDQPRIGYVVNAFPVVSETFLVNELRGVERAGVAVAVLTLSRRHDRVHPHGTNEIDAPILRPPAPLPFGWLAFAGSHLAGFIRAPGPYLRMIRDDLLWPLGRAAAARGRAGAWRSARRRARIFLLAPLMARQARQARVALLHAHYAKDPLEIAVRVRWLTGIPYSFAAHAKDLYTTPPRRLARRLAKAKFALTCHRHGQRTLRRLARAEDHEKVLLTPHGFDQQLFHRDVTPREPGLIVAAGRLTPKKGFETLIEACADLQAAMDFRCVILGTGRLEKTLHQMIDDHGLASRVELRGAVDQQELAAWYRRATTVALPARVLGNGNRDGIPNVLVEAMACGTPVVTTAVGGIPELVDDGRNGLLVEPEQPKALAEALRTVLTQPSLAARLGAAGEASVASRDFEVCCRPVAEKLRRQLARAPGETQSAFEPPPVDSQKMAAKAVRRLGIRPRLRPEVERAIARSVLPGLRANAWRPDLQRMAERRLWDELSKAGRAGELRRFVQSRGVRLDERSRVLDLGCGRGGISVALEAQGVSSVPLDLRLRNCRVTRMRGQRYGFELPATVGRAEALPFADQAFDVVCLLEVLEHVSDPVGLLTEARRVSRPEGVCVVTVVNRWAHLDPHYRLWGINFMPRRWAQGIIALFGRSKQSWGDNQRLDDMHYFSFGAFRRFAGAIGFKVHDPGVPRGFWAAHLHRLGRRLSLGYNTVTLVLEPR